MGRMRMFPLMGVPMGGKEKIAPVPVITTAAVEPVSAAFDIAIAFTNGAGGPAEAVTGFTIGDLTVTNGAASNFAGSGAAYTATITPDWAGDVSIAVPAGACVDGAGNENTTAVTLTVTMSAPINTLAPAINAAAVIGTVITPTPGTWTPGSPTLTYQWQHYTGGAWADIVGATIANRAPVDANFGLLLRLTEIATNAAGSTVAYSNQTNLVVEAPAQSVSVTELITNGGFEGEYTDGVAPSWSKTGTPTVAESADAYAGSKAQSVTDSADSSKRLNQTFSTTAGDVIYWSIAGKRASGSGNGRAFTFNDTAVFSTASYVNRIFLGRASSTSADILLYADNATAVTLFDALSAKALALNAQLVAPAANMRLDFLYTLPGTPEPGTRVWILPRISNWAAGNNWRGQVIYTGSQWNIDLYTVASGTATSRIAATNIGATNGVRVNMNGDQVGLFTTANGGTDWTQRGTTITNNTYQTSTGVNALWTPDVTPGQLIFANPT